MRARAKTEPNLPALRFTVPLVPPSVNHYIKHTRRGKHYITPEAQAFKDAVALFIRGGYVTGKRFAVVLWVTFGKGDRGDWDNFGKLPCDGLAAAGAFRDHKGKILSDAHVRDGRVVIDCDSRPEYGFTEIEVRAIV